MIAYYAALLKGKATLALPAPVRRPVRFTIDQYNGQPVWTALFNDGTSEETSDGGTVERWVKLV